MNEFWETGITIVKVSGRTIVWARNGIYGSNMVRAVSDFKLSVCVALTYVKIVFCSVK